MRKRFSVAVVLGLLIVGLSLLALALITSPRDDEDPGATAEIEVFDLPAAVVTSPTPAAATATETSAVPTATPFAGEVASFRIERFGVDAAVENIGLVPGVNQMDVPKDPLNVGWYGIYDRPGWGGTSVFSAHVDYWPDIRGPFFELHKLEPGDEVVVVMADATEYRYRVFRKQRYDVATIPTGDLLWPPDKPQDEEWITMITCGGRFRAYLDGSGAGEYLDRDVVVAVRVA